MAEPLLTYRGTVYPWHCDHMGHMNVMWYVGKFDEATWNLLAHLGMTPEYLRTTHRGMVAVHQELDYRSEVLAGDVVSVYSTLVEARPKVLKFRHKLFRGEDGEAAAETTLTAVHLDTESRSSTSLPPDVLKRAQELVERSPRET
jgi:acyl-CoA thioester hydrolase